MRLAYERVCMLCGPGCFLSCLPFNTVLVSHYVVVSVLDGFLVHCRGHVVLHTTVSGIQHCALSSRNTKQLDLISLNVDATE